MPMNTSLAEVSGARRIRRWYMADSTIETHQPNYSSTILAWIADVRAYLAELKTRDSENRQELSDACEEEIRQ
ncbi:MAG: hypothetical protein V1659_00045 [Candidatus Woesearchaeota archaeon]